MVVNDVIKITDEIRSKLSEIVTSQYNLIEQNISEYFVYKDKTTPGNFEYTNYFSQGKSNMVRTLEGIPMMTIFNFDTKHTVKLFRLLKLENFKPQLNAIRVFANTELPMHMDLNRGNIGRESPIYSIMLTGKEAMVFFSNKNDGSRLAAIPSLSEFVMFPTMIQHGALTADEHMDVLQIQLNDLI